MTRKFSFGRGQTVTLQHRGVTKTVADWGNEPVPTEEIEIAAWDGKTVVVPQAITSISQGHVIPKDGGGTYIVLSDLPEFNEITKLTAETDTGTPVKVNVIPRRQKRGHAKAINYMLPIDKATGFIKFEKGRYGHKYYATKRPRTDVSGKGGYTRQQIADELGVNVSTITDTWIRDNGIYGKSENKPLEFVTACTLWNTLVSASGTSRFFQSNWLVIEAGFDYYDFRWTSGNFIPESASGEGPFYPLLITSYGEGNRPHLNHRGENTKQNEDTATWLCYQNVNTNFIDGKSHFSAIYSHVGALGSNLDKGSFYLEGGPNAGIDGSGYKTMYRCNSYDSHPLPADELKDSVTNYENNTWGGGGANHRVGVYASNLRSCLLLENHIDMSGWERGYDDTNQIYVPGDPNQRKPVPPTGLAHNMYLQHDMSDFTVIDNICSRGASHAIQIRPGGLVYGNWLMEANVFGNAPGTSKDPVTDADAKAAMGNYCSFIGNLLTSAAYKRVTIRPPAKNWGFDLDGRDGEAFENVIMHWANPDDAAEIADKKIEGYDQWMNGAIKYSSLREYAQPADNCIHKWFHPNYFRYPEENAVAKGADPAVLDTRTVQNFAEAQMGALLNEVAEAEKVHAYLDWLRTLTPAGRMEQLRLFKEYFRSPWGIHRAKRTAAGTSVFQPDLRFSGLDWHFDRNWTDEMVPGKDYKDNAQLRGAFVRFGIYTCEMATVDGQGSPLLECVSGRLTVDTLNNIDVVRVRDVSGQLYIKTATNVPTFLVTQGRLVFDCPISGKDLIIDNQYAQVFLGPDYTVSTGKVLDIKIGRQGYIGHKGTGTAALTVQSGGTLRFRWHDYKDDRIRQFAKLERIQEDWSTPASTVDVTVTLDAGSNIEVEKGAAVAGSVHDLTGPGYTVVNNGATLPAGVAITGGKLVYTVPA